MGSVPGTDLGKVWDDLREQARITIVTRLAELEGQLFNLSSPASGSLHYVEGLDSKARKIDVPVSDPSYGGRLCLHGP